MATPIFLNFRIVERKENKILLAISQFGFNDSGFSVECEHDSAFEHPWGVRVMELKLGKGIAYFNMMRDHFFLNASETQQKEGKDKLFALKISESLSTHLNSFYGFTVQGSPLSIPLTEFESLLSERVYTVIVPENLDLDIKFTPLNLKMKELYNEVYMAHSFNNGLPNHILNPKVSA